MSENDKNPEHAQVQQASPLCTHALSSFNQQLNLFNDGHNDQCMRSTVICLW